MLVHEIYLALPVLRSREEKYYDEADRRRNKGQQELEKQWQEAGTPADEIPTQARKTQEELDWRPPWLFNDTIGFLAIGPDHGTHLAGDIYLKRKHFPKGTQQRGPMYRGLQKQAFVHYREVGRYPVVPGQNESYVDVVTRIIRRAEIEIRKRFSGAVVWTPPFDLSFISWAEIHAASGPHS